MWRGGHEYMKLKKKDMTSVSHEEYMIRKLRVNPRFVADLGCLLWLL
jgi:hypothetical protein